MDRMVPGTADEEKAGKYKLIEVLPGFFTIKNPDGQLPGFKFIDTAEIYSVDTGICDSIVEGIDAAVFTKIVIYQFRFKTIDSQAFFAGNYFKRICRVILLRHNRIFSTTD